MALFNWAGFTFVGLASSFVAFLLVRKFLFFLTLRSFRDGPYVVGQHQWRPGKLAGLQWCNVCEAIVYGIRSYVVKCDICGMHAHAQCAVTLMRSSGKSGSVSDASVAIASSPARPCASPCACKIPGVSRLPSSGQVANQHLWIKGNIDSLDACSLCGLFCGSILALSGLKCAWCHVRVHEECFQQALGCRARKPPLLRHCDLGRHASLILPPSCVLLHDSVTNASKSQRALNSVRSAAQIAVTKMSKIRLRRGSASENGVPPTLSTSKLRHGAAFGGEHASTTSDPPYDLVETPKDVTPLLVFINSRSGGKMGLHVLRQVRMWLNPLQVYDLSHQSPIEPLRVFTRLPRLRILVCGGDGTVGWVLSALDEVGPKRQPPIAILPLGTGNDLARVIGWGAGLSAPTDVSELLSEVEAAHVSLLDRWQVNMGEASKRVVLNNYMGIGVDAQVALEFHEQRERSPGLFMSQFVNKLWYSQYGAKNFLVRTCAGLSEKMSLACDGKGITIPTRAEGIILLNINSYGGGSKLWHDDSDDEDFDSASDADSHNDRSRTSSGDSLETNKHCGSSSPHDGLLDVVAVYGTLHLGQMQVGLSKAVRLCQAKSVQITLKETVPVQIDGEPWLQSPGKLEISFLQQAFMLSRTIGERDLVTKKVGEVLEWAEHTHVISSRQHDVLQVEVARRVAESAASRRLTRSRALLHHRGHERFTHVREDR